MLWTNIFLVLQFSGHFHIFPRFSVYYTEDVGERHVLVMEHETNVWRLANSSEHFDSIPTPTFMPFSPNSRSAHAQMKIWNGPFLSVSKYCVPTSHNNSPCRPGTFAKLLFLVFCKVLRLRPVPKYVLRNVWICAVNIWTNPVHRWCIRKVGTR